MCRMYLGYPSNFRYLNYRLEGAMDTAGKDPDVPDMVRTALSGLATVESKILTISTNTAGLKRVDEIEFYQNSQISEVRSVGRMYVTRISVLLGVPIYSDIFGTKGYLGDRYSAGGLANKSGNIIPLG
jgi:hypothetical protein